MNLSYDEELRIFVGSRPSPLAQVQVEEVLTELQHHHPKVAFSTTLISSTGDVDLHTSLRSLGKSDFFTKEIDEAVANGACRIGIHSAKDLPEPLHPLLKLICLTRGLTPIDSLVLSPTSQLHTLPKGALIATSSDRREEAVRYLRDDLSFCDLRGTIGERLLKLERGEVDGVVIAEAALIRLKLTHLNRISLPGPTHAGQGQLAVVARKNDQEMAHLFSCLNEYIAHG